MLSKAIGKKTGDAIGVARHLPDFGGHNTQQHVRKVHKGTIADFRSAIARQ